MSRWSKYGRTGRRRLLVQRLAQCRRKIRYASWEDARLAGLAVWIDAPREGDTNPALPYECDLLGEPHYHIGHLRFGAKKGITMPTADGPTAYCPTCRAEFPVESAPPYAVVHLSGGHVHPITRETLAGAA